MRDSVRRLNLADPALCHGIVQANIHLILAGRSLTIALPPGNQPLMNRVTPLTLVILGGAVGLSSWLLGGCTDAAAQTAPAGSASAPVDSAGPSLGISLSEARSQQTELMRLIDALKSMKASLDVENPQAQSAAAWIGRHLGDGAEEFSKAKSDAISGENERINALQSEIDSVVDDLRRTRTEAREQASARAAFARELAAWNEGKAAHPSTYPDDAPQPLPGAELSSAEEEAESIRQAQGHLAALRSNLMFHRRAKAYLSGFSYDALCSTVVAGCRDLARSASSTDAQAKAVDDAVSELNAQSEANKQTMRTLASNLETPMNPKAASVMRSLGRETLATQNPALSKAMSAARKEKTFEARDKGVVQAIRAFVASPMPTSPDLAQRYSSTVLASIRSLSTSAHAPSAKYLAYVTER